MSSIERGITFESYTLLAKGIKFYYNECLTGSRFEPLANHHHWLYWIGRCPDKTLTVCLFFWDASTLYFYNYLHSASKRRWTHTTVQIFHYVKIFRTCSLLPHSPAFHNNLILWHIWFLSAYYIFRWGVMGD